MSTVKSICDRINGPMGQFLKGALRVYLKRRDPFSKLQLKMAMFRFFVGRSISRVNAIDRYVEAISTKNLDKNCVLDKLGYKFMYHDGQACFDTLWGDFSNIVLTDFYNQEEIIQKLAPGLHKDFVPKSQDDFLFYLIGEGPYQYKGSKMLQGDVIVDAGANMGVFSVFAAKNGACVHAFEPQPSCFDVLCDHIKMNSFVGTITPWKLALAEKNGQVEFTSLEGTVDSGATMVENRIDENATKYSVECVTLDEWAKNNGINRVDFIKADIEGAERLMLEGAQHILRECKPRLSICTYHLPDDPCVLEELILKGNSSYQIAHTPEKIFAW